MATNSTSSLPGPINLPNSLKSQQFSDVSDYINIGEFKRILFSYLEQHPFKQGPVSDRDNLCEEMGIDEPVLADIERICSVEGLQHREGDDVLKNLNMNTLGEFTKLYFTFIILGSVHVGLSCRIDHLLGFPTSSSYRPDYLENIILFTHFVS